MDRALVAADFHFPFESKTTCEFFLLYVQWYRPRIIILDGDFLDLYSISRFDTAPSRADDLSYELTCAKEYLMRLREAAGANCEIIFIIGNHEIRMEAFLSRGKNKALHSLSCLKIENLLEFDRYKITKVDDIYTLNKNFIITHGSKCGINCAQAEGLSYGKSGMSGHAHKELIFKRKFIDRYIEWYSIPCMCDIAEAKYAIKFSHTWVNGFAQIEFDDRKAKVDILTTMEGEKWPSVR